MVGLLFRDNFGPEVAFAAMTADRPLSSAMRSNDDSDWPVHFYYVVHKDLVRAVENNQVTILVMLDLSAAFNKVGYNVLLPVLFSRFNVTRKVYEL